MERAFGMRGAGPVWRRFWIAWYGHPAVCRAVCGLAVAACAAACALAAAAAFPGAAYAGVIDEMKEMLSGLNDSLNTIFNLGEVLMRKAAENLNCINTEAIATEFGSLLGSEAYAVVTGMASGITKYCGYSILAVVYLIQLGKLGARMDGNATLPGFRDVMFLLIFFCIFKHLVDHSLDYCEALYNGANEITLLIGNGAGGYIGNVVDADAAVEKWLSWTGDNWAFNVIYGLLLLLCSLGMRIAAAFSVVGRSLQAYLYAMFAPIPLALLGAEETRQWGIGYIKNFAAVCLTGAVILAVLTLFPYLVSMLRYGAIETVAVCLLGIQALTHSGQWARDVLGG